MKQSFSLFMVLAVGVLFGCKSNTTSPQSQMYTGTMTAIGAGTANSWIMTDASGNFTSIGVTISDAALASIGTTDAMFEIPIPAGVTSPYKSIALSYATHDPAPYDKPHIDPHFFLIDMNARMMIMDGIDTVKPIGMMMPAGYAQMSQSEMMMGVHWMDTTAPEMHGQPFQSTFVYGFSKGAMVFMEPMFDIASLDAQKSMTGTIKRPSMMSGMSMSIPMTYAVSHDASAKSTKIELDGFSQ